MPVRYDIEPQVGIVRVVGEGPVSFWDDRQCLERILDDSRYRPGFGFLIDNREREPNASPDHVRAMASAFGESAERLGRSKLAFVVAKDVSFGLARMFSALTGDLEMEIEIFRSIEEAEAWLGPETRTP